MHPPHLDFNVSTGWEQRRELLQRDAEEKILNPLRTHGWQAAIDNAVEHGEYLPISAERGP